MNFNFFGKMKTQRKVEKDGLPMENTAVNIYVRAATDSGAGCALNRERSLIWAWKWKALSRVWLFASPWTIEPTEFSRPQYWSA